MSEVKAFLERMRAKALTSLAQVGVGGNAPPRISIKGNDFHAVTGNSETKVSEYDRATGLFIDVVIVDMNPSVSKLWYEGDYDPKATEYVAPACWSDNGVGPSATSLKPQSETCAACEKNVWGSAVNKMTGKAAKACNDARKLAVILANDPDGVVYQLRVPPASLKELATYGRLLEQNGDQLNFVVTRISFVPQSVGGLAFERVDYITDKHVPILEKGEPEWAWVVGADDKPRQGALPAPARQTALPAPSPTQALSSAAEQAQAAEGERRRRRTKAEMEAARAAETKPPVAAASEPDDELIAAKAAYEAAVAKAAKPAERDITPLKDDEIPSFLSKGKTFGMEPVVAADKGMSDALTAALRLPTR